MASNQWLNVANQIPVIQKLSCSHSKSHYHYPDPIFLKKKVVIQFDPITNYSNYYFSGTTLMLKTLLLIDKWPTKLYNLIKWNNRRNFLIITPSHPYRSLVLKFKSCLNYWRSGDNALAYPPHAPNVASFNNWCCQRSFIRG